MKVCPRCTLFSPDTAKRCDCGFNFSMASPDAIKSELAESGRQAVRGLLLGIGAIGLSVGLFVITGAGGMYVLSYGAAFAGLALAGRSITRIVDLRKARKEIENSLAQP